VGRSNFFGGVSLDHIACFDVLESLKGDPALEALFDLADVVFESSQRFYFALEDHYVVAKYPSSRPFDRPVNHVAACNLTDFGTRNT
jgi:hypothetical protein